MGNSHAKPALDPNTLQLNHFRLLRVIGKGAFGKVRIVQHKATDETYALKYIRKEDVIRSESIRNIIRERRMLEQLQHPFLCNLRYSFQDIEYLYLVVDLMQGGDLRFHLSRKAFTEDAVRFWIAELACALDYIHAKNIVHRDVKPDNILLDRHGHVHLADFNVAAEVAPDGKLTSRSGTYAYIAPEVLNGRPYRTVVDWWSLGVVFYECIYNRRPFADTSNIEVLISQIVSQEPDFPVTVPPVSLPCVNAITGFLNRDPISRLGANGFDRIRAHPFFRPLDFDRLTNKEIEPVFIPSSEKTNFDATYDLEELLLEDIPLEVRARRMKPREKLPIDATDEEQRTEELYQVMEAKFTTFDFTAPSVRERAAIAGQSEPALGPAEQPESPISLASPATEPATPAVRSPSGSVSQPERALARPGVRGAPLATVPNANTAASWSPTMGEPGSVKQVTKQNSSSVLGFWSRKKSKPLERGVLPHERLKK